MAITVVGLGPGDGRFLTREAWQILSTAETVYLRTKRHPAAADLPASVNIASFDELYETAASFETVYDQAGNPLVKRALSMPGGGLRSESFYNYGCFLPVVE